MQFRISRYKTGIPKERRQELEDLHRQFCETLETIEPSPHPDRVAKQAVEISDIYNGIYDAPSFERKDLADARLHFFLPTDMPKVWLPLEEAFNLVDLSDRKRLTIADLGAGAGTASAATAMYLHNRGFKGEAIYTLVEPDRVVGELTGTVFHTLKHMRLPKIEHKWHRSKLNDYLEDEQKARFDIVLVHGVLSEMVDEEHYPAHTVSLVMRLLREKVKKTGFLILIEPALKRISRPLYEAMSRLQEEERIMAVAPCLADVRCPFTLTDDRFCFHSIAAPLSPQAQSVGARSQLDRHEVNFSYLVLRPRGGKPKLPSLEEGEIDVGRIISFPKRLKMGYMYFICTRNGVVQGVAPRRMDDDDRTRGNRLKTGDVVWLTPW